MSAPLAHPADTVTAALTELERQLAALPGAGRLGAADTEAVYALAYREYGQARYEQALRYFQLLLVYRTTNKVYLLGAALCLQRLRRYELAVAAFDLLRMLEPEKPGHTLALAECQLLCHLHGEARDTLAQVSDFCRRNTGHDKVLARAQAMLELMRPPHEPVAA